MCQVDLKKADDNQVNIRCWCQAQVWVLFPKLTGSSIGPLTAMPSPGWGARILFYGGRAGPTSGCGSPCAWDVSCGMEPQWETIPPSPPGTSSGFWCSPLPPSTTVQLSILKSWAPGHPCCLPPGHAVTLPPPPGNHRVFVVAKAADSHSSDQGPV